MMADAYEKLLSCPGFDGPSNLRREADCYAKTAALQDQLADCLFQMEAENTSYAPLDGLLNQLDEAAPLPEDKTLDTEKSLAAFHQTIDNVHCTAPCTPSFTNRVPSGIFSPCSPPLVASSSCFYEEPGRKSIRADRGGRFTRKRELNPWLKLS